MLIESLFILLIIIIGILSFVVYKTLNRLSFFEDFYEDIFEKFKPAAKLANDILNSNLYSNEPMVVDFVESLKDLNHYLSQINNEYNLVEEDNQDG